MLTDLLWTFILCAFIVLGIKRPYVLLAAVIWTDVLRPQDLSFSFLIGKPLSLIVTFFFLLSFVINFSKLKKPESLKPTFILLFLIVWVTICNLYAVAPAVAWLKYDYVIKTLIFCLFIPFVIHKQRHLDFVIGVYVASLSYYALTAGVRSLTGSGGYGAQLVYTRGGDSGAAETSTLSMLSVMLIPLIVYLIKYSEYVKDTKIIKWILTITALCCVAGMVGTHARTGLIGFIVLLMAFVYFSKYKIKIILAFALAIPVMISFLPADYLSRMNTIKSANTETSALGRIVVWKWTVDFVSYTPIVGGGFNSYVANAGQLKRFIPDGEEIRENEDSGKAFHSIYFETLGETGYVGIIAYLFMMYTIWKLNIQSARTSSVESQKRLAIALNLCLLVYASCGAFIGIAFAPWVFYLLGFSSCLYTVVCDKKNNNNLSAAG